MQIGLLAVPVLIYPDPHSISQNVTPPTVFKLKPESQAEQTEAGSQVVQLMTSQIKLHAVLSLLREYVGEQAPQVVAVAHVLQLVIVQIAEHEVEETSE